MPIMVQITGMRHCSAKASNIGCALAEKTPPPAQMIGRALSRSAFAALRTCNGWPFTWGLYPMMSGLPWGRISEISACCMSTGMSMSTGPGRPLAAM